MTDEQRQWLYLMYRYMMSRDKKLAHPKISGVKFEHRDAETRRNNLEK